MRLEPRYSSLHDIFIPFRFAQRPGNYRAKHSKRRHGPTLFFVCVELLGRASWSVPLALPEPPEVGFHSRPARCRAARCGECEDQRSGKGSGCCGRSGGGQRASLRPPPLAAQRHSDRASRILRKLGARLCFSFLRRSISNAGNTQPVGGKGLRRKPKEAAAARGGRPPR